jgi:hypothetical protein
METSNSQVGHLYHTYRNQLGTTLVSSSEACGAPCLLPHSSASPPRLPLQLAADCGVSWRHAGNGTGSPPAAAGSVMSGPTRRVAVVTGITISRQLNEQRPEAGSGTFHAGELSGRPR